MTMRPFALLLTLAGALCLVVGAILASLLLNQSGNAAVQQPTPTVVSSAPTTQSYTNTATAAPTFTVPFDDIKIRVHPIVSQAKIMAYAQGKIQGQFAGQNGPFIAKRAGITRDLGAVERRIARLNSQQGRLTKQLHRKHLSDSAKARLNIRQAEMDAQAADLDKQRGKLAKNLKHMREVPTVKQWGCLVKLWNGESGWDVYAKNKKSGAYGIPQSLPGHKMQAMGEDWEYEYKTQIRWGLAYISSSYQTPCNAWKQWQHRSPHWY